MKKIANEPRQGGSLYPFLGTNYLIWRESIDGIFISYEPELIDEIGAPLSDPSGKKFLAGKAVEIFDGDWEVTFPNNKQYYFSKKEIRFPKSMDLK